MQVRASWCWSRRRVTRVNFGQPDGDHLTAGRILQVSVPRTVAAFRGYTNVGGSGPVPPERVYEYELVGHIEQCLPVVSLLAPICTGMTKRLTIRLYRLGFVNLTSH